MLARARCDFRRRVDPGNWPAEAELSYSVEGGRSRNVAIGSRQDYHRIPLGSRTVRLQEGEHWLGLSPGNVDVLIDGVCLTSERGYKPVGSGHLLEHCVRQPQNATAEAEGPFSARLSWTESRDPMITAYNVYGNTTTEIEATNRRRIATVKRAEWLDWGLRPGRTHRYRVAAVNRFGRESRLSDECVIRIPKYDPATVKIDTERWPERVEFSLPRDGRYVVWARLRTKQMIKEESLSAKVKLDGQPQRTWRPRISIISRSRSGPQPHAWFWDRLNLGDARQYLTVNMTAGAHVITFRPASPNGCAEIGKVIVTDDLAFVPNGRVDYVTGAR